MLYEHGKIGVRLMRESDIPLIASAEQDFSDGFAAYFKRQLGWQRDGACSALLADFDGAIAGYVFLHHPCRWGGMRGLGLPGLTDLFVLEQYRSRGVGSALMDAAERLARQKSDRVYLDVPVSCDHGSAQRLYAKRGYLPDGRGLYHDADGNGLCEVCPAGSSVRNDDSVTICMVKSLV